MHRRRRFVAAVGAVTASMIVGLQDTPAQAMGTTGVIVDADGVDYDAACREPTQPRSSAPPADSVASPNGTGCTTSRYDGSTESTDIRSVSLESTSTGRLKASMTIDGPIPAAGSTNQAAIDGINGATSFAQYWVFFQNKDKQNGADNPSGGCTSGLNTRFADRHGHWADGHQWFLMYEVDFLGGYWSHSLYVGEWDTETPSTYRPIRIARNNGSGWTTTQPPMAGRWATSLTGSGPTTIDMEVTGRIYLSDPNCVHNNGIFVWDMASNFPGPFSGPDYTGDRIANVKGATYVDQVFGPPVDVFGWPGVVSVNGFSDVTTGNSTAGPLNSKIPGVSMTYGLVGAQQDVFASGPFCRFYVASTPINNPLATLNPNQPCQVDDDAIDRGTVNFEWWDTNYGFTF